MNTLPSDTYLSFILSRPLMEVWNIFLLSLARIVPMIAISPFLGGKTVPNTIKMGYAAAITFLFLPFLILHTTSVPVHRDMTFMLLLIKEALLGSIIGMLVSVPYSYAQSAGSLIDHQRGSQSLQVGSPGSSDQTSPTGMLFASFMLILFYALGGVLYFFEGVFLSFKLIPINEFFPADFFSMTKPLFLTFLQLSNIVLKMTIQMAAPPLLAMLLSDLFLGIANRMAPQVQITFLLYALKSFAALGILTVCWWVLVKQFEVEITAWLRYFMDVIKSF